MSKVITTSLAQTIGTHLGINFEKVSLDQLTKGMNVELEHGTIDSETNVSDDDLFMTAKIAWAHLKELPDYYTRLEEMEKESVRAKAAL